MISPSTEPCTVKPQRPIAAFFIAISFVTDGENFLDGCVDAFPCYTPHLETLDCRPAVVAVLLLGIYPKPFIDWAVAVTLMFSNSALSQLVLQASFLTG